MKEKLDYLIEFINDDTVYFAASLSFFTIFSLLPIVALIIFVMSSTPYFSSQIDILMSYLYDLINPTHSQRVIDVTQEALENVHKLGSIGFIYLFFIFTMFFKDYEYIVNKIHHTKKRSFIAIILLYISLLILIPISLLTIAFVISYMPNNFLIFLANLIFAIIIVTLLFKISANKYVSFKASFISALITVSALKITQTLFIYYVTYNTAYLTIYGTLSVMLFVFLWIYVSWIIYLYGVKITYRLNKGSK